MKPVSLIVEITFQFIRESRMAEENLKGIGCRIATLRLIGETFVLLEYIEFVSFVY